MKGASVITCDAPAVTEGEPATITCHFNQDVKQTRKQFLVKRRLYWAKFDPDSMETMMTCYWINTQSDVQCNSAKGFQLRHLGSKTTIDITRASQSLTGSYTCEVVPSDPEDIQSCEFLLKESTEEATRASTQLNNQNVHVEMDSVKGAVFVVVALCLVILIVLVGVVMLVFRKKLKARCSMCLFTTSSPSSSHEPVEEEAEIELLQHLTPTSAGINTTRSNVHSNEAIADGSTAAECNDMSNPIEKANRERKWLQLSVHKWRKRKEMEIKGLAKEMEAEERLELAEKELKEYNEKNSDISCYIGRKKQDNVTNAQGDLAVVKKKNEDRRLQK